MDKDLVIVVAAVVKYLGLSDQSLKGQRFKSLRVNFRTLSRDKQVWKWSLRFTPRPALGGSPWRQGNIR